MMKTDLRKRESTGGKAEAKAAGGVMWRSRGPGKEGQRRLCGCLA